MKDKVFESREWLRDIRNRVRAELETLPEPDRSAALAVPFLVGGDPDCPDCGGLGRVQELSGQAVVHLRCLRCFPSQLVEEDRS